MTSATNMAGTSGDARPANRVSVDARLHGVSPTHDSSGNKAPASSAGAASEFELTLPLPPSTNNLFKTVQHGGRAKTGSYRDWIKTAGWNIEQLQIAPLRGRYELTIMLPAAMRGDISNRIKAVEDLLVAHRLTDDDSRCDAVIARRHERIAPKTCVVVAKLSPALASVGGGPTPLLDLLPRGGAEAPEA
jgi:Holliday junction resolvase RusA-like endonuclease